MSQTRTEYAIALLEETDWQLPAALIALRRRLVDNYVAGLKTLTETVDLATVIAHEIHDQADLHDLEVHRERNAQLFRERYAELMPNERINSNA
jgi:hypothetical protein